MRNGESQSRLLDIFEIAKNEAIQLVEISQKRRALYVSTDHRIKQIDLALCNKRYDSCFRCVKDPYCGWDQDLGACKPYEWGLLQVRLPFNSWKNPCAINSKDKLIFSFLNPWRTPKHIISFIRPLLIQPNPSRKVVTKKSTQNFLKN